MDHRMTRVSAWQLAQAWTARASADTKSLMEREDGTFWGDLGSLEFLFVAESHTLLVKAQVASAGEHYRRHIEHLNRTALEDPAATAGGIFEVALAPPVFGEHQWRLNLRRDFADPDIVEIQFLNETEHLARVAFLWSQDMLFVELTRG